MNNLKSFSSPNLKKTEYVTENIYRDPFVASVEGLCLSDFYWCFCNL